MALFDTHPSRHRLRCPSPTGYAVPAPTSSASSRSCAGPYWRSEHRWKVLGITLLFALTLAQVAFAVWTNYWNRALFDAPVLLAFAYAGAGIGLGLLLGRPLVKTTNKLQNLEANFRFGLMRARENSAAITLMRGEGVERQRSARQFAELKFGWNRQTFCLA